MNDSNIYIPHTHIRPLPEGPLYESREARGRFVAQHFLSIMRGRILDVGCSDRGLRTSLPPDVECVGIDLFGKPDIRVDLDAGYLPFADRSFDVVVCTDVLEHLEKIHFVFDELIRLCREYVIVSLPNCWHGTWRWFLPGGALQSGKYYGLPLERPIDRHRWFFNALEAANFLRERAQKNGARVIWQDTVQPQSAAKGKLLRTFWGPKYWVRGVAAVWAVIARK